MSPHRVQSSTLATLHMGATMGKFCAHHFDKFKSVKPCVSAAFPDMPSHTHSMSSKLLWGPQGTLFKFSVTPHLGGSVGLAWFYPIQHMLVAHWLEAPLDGAPFGLMP